MTWLYNFKNLESQLARWLEALQEYNFTIEHRKGRLHGNADVMSRKPFTQCGRDSHSNANTDEAKLALIEQHTVIPARSDEDFRKLQLADPSIAFVLQAKETVECPNSDVIKGQKFNSSEVNAVVAKIGSC